MASKPIRILSALEVGKRMEMDLYLLCDELFTVEHHQLMHKNVRYLVREMEDEPESEQEKDGGHEDEDKLQTEINPAAYPASNTNTVLGCDEAQGVVGSFQRFPEIDAISFAPKIPFKPATKSTTSAPSLESEEFEEEPPLLTMTAFDLLGHEAVSATAVPVTRIGPFDPGPLPTMTSLYLHRDDASSSAGNVPLLHTGPYDPGPLASPPPAKSLSDDHHMFIDQLEELTTEISEDLTSPHMYSSPPLLVSVPTSSYHQQSPPSRTPPPKPPDGVAELVSPRNIGRPAIKDSSQKTTPGEFSSCAAAIVSLLHSGKIIHEVTTCGHSAASHYPNVYSHSKLLTAIQVFDEIPKCLVGGWNPLITGCMNSGPEGVAFGLFKDMPRMDIGHGNYTFTSNLSLDFLELLNYGRHVHFLVNSLITMSFTCSCDYTAGNNVMMTMNPCSRNVGESQNVFQKLEKRSFASWKIMLSLFVQKNINEGICFIYLKMRIVEIELDDFTFGNLLVALSALQIVGMLHSYLFKNGFMNVGVLKAFAVSYCKHGKIHYAFQILYGFPYKGLISWVRIIFDVVLKMHNRPNIYSLNLVLSICYITLTMHHGTQELVRINDGKKREAPNIYGPTDKYLSCGVSITSGIQDACSRASITGVTVDKESGGGSVKKSDAFIKKAAGGVDWFMNLGLYSLERQGLNLKNVSPDHEDDYISVIISECQL